MLLYMEKTTIAISKSTREALKVLGKKDEDYDAIIKRCVGFAKRSESAAVQLSDETRYRLNVIAACKNTTHDCVLDDLVKKEMHSLKLDTVKLNERQNSKK